MLFKNEPSKFVKDFKDIVCLGRPYHFKFFKGFLPQILLGQFLNTYTFLENKKISGFLMFSKDV